MHFNCTFCGGKIEGEEAWIGLDSVCPYCKMEITVPEPLVRDTTPVPIPTEEDAVSIADVDAETAAKTTEGAATTSSDVTFGGGSSGENFIDLNGKWIAGGVLGLVVLIIIMMSVPKVAETGSSYPDAPRHSASTRLGDKQKVNQGAYDAYMMGYKNPENAEIANYTISETSSDAKNYLILINRGAADRRKGLPVSVELVK